MTSPHCSSLLWPGRIRPHVFVHRCPISVRRCHCLMRPRPSGKSLLSHVLHLRELLVNKVLTALAWNDTRDMLADGLTKGAVGRTALHMSMDGHMLLTHEHAMYNSRAPATIAGSSLDSHVVLPASPVSLTQTALFAASFPVFRPQGAPTMSQ